MSENRREVIWDPIGLINILKCIKNNIKWCFIACDIQGDQKVSVHLTITVQQKQGKNMVF